MHPIWEWSDHSLILFFGSVACNAASSALRAQDKQLLSAFYLLVSIATGIWLLAVTL